MRTTDNSGLLRAKSFLPLTDRCFLDNIISVSLDNNGDDDDQQ
jgi:hypothetical protein